MTFKRQVVQYGPDDDPNFTPVMSWKLEPDLPDEEAQWEHFGTFFDCITIGPDPRGPQPEAEEAR